MAFSSISSRAASAVPLIGIGLALANWNARPAAARAWAIAIVMLFVMIAVRYGWQFALRRSSRNKGTERGVVIHAALARTATEVNRGVVFGALMMVIPLAAALAHSYGLVDVPNSGRWTAMTMIVLGAYLAVLGNDMPRQLPPLSSMQGDGARIQTFQRRTGWTWVLCGLGFAVTWLVLPIAEARRVSVALVAGATIVTIVQLLRIRKVRVHTSGLH
jgi:hypothetical protein